MSKKFENLTTDTLRTTDENTSLPRRLRRARGETSSATAITAMMVSQTGSGYSWRGNAGQNRITRSFQDLIKDNWGKYFYIRDLKRNVYWSAAYKPVMHPYEHFSVVHGMGYSRFIQQVEDIESELDRFCCRRRPGRSFPAHADQPQQRDARAGCHLVCGVVAGVCAG